MLASRLDQGFNPASFFGSRLLYWNDPSDLSLTWQDSARTTPGAIGSAVGSRQNKGTLAGYMQQATGGSRPILRRSAQGYYYDELDGMDDSFGSSASLDLTPYDKITVCIGLTKASDATLAVAMEHSAAGVFSVDGTFLIAAPVTPGEASYTALLRGTTTTPSARSMTYTAPTSNVVMASFDTAAVTVATQIIPLINGVTPTTVTNTATPTTAANFSSNPLYEGRRGNTSLPLSGDLYQRIIVAGVLTAEEKLLLNRFVGAKMGIGI